MCGLDHQTVEYVVGGQVRRPMWKHFELRYLLRLARRGGMLDVFVIGLGVGYRKVGGHGVGGCHDWWLCTSLLFHVVDPAVVWIELQLYLRHVL